MIHHRLHNGIQLFIDDFDLFKPAQCAARSLSLYSRSNISYARKQCRFNLSYCPIASRNARLRVHSSYSIGSQMLSLAER